MGRHPACGWADLKIKIYLWIGLLLAQLFQHCRNYLDFLSIEYQSPNKSFSQIHVILTLTTRFCSLQEKNSVPWKYRNNAGRVKVTLFLLFLLKAACVWQDPFLPPLSLCFLHKGQVQSRTTVKRLRRLKRLRRSYKSGDWATESRWKRPVLGKKWVWMK